MISPPKNDTWIWVFVQSAGTAAQYVGQHDETSGVSFIPAFFEKADAQQCLPRIVPASHPPCEAQAVRFGDLAADAASNGFMIFLLNRDGGIIHKVDPSAI